MATWMAAIWEAFYRIWLLAVAANFVTISSPANFVARQTALPPAPNGGRLYNFNIEYVNWTVNCQTKPILTVNGEYPGPTIYLNEGDRLIVNVTNNTPANITIHFHGVRQDHSPWMDGVPYVSMCPIQQGNYFVHNFTVPSQRGTLLWHAHVGWQRGTVHGAIVIYPEKGDYPTFPPPYGEFELIFQEWWYNDVEEEEIYGLNKGSPFNVSDAMTINGHPGPNYNCSAEEGYSIFNVVPNKTYLLRLVNAELNTHLFFAVANHNLTVVEADANYLQPIETSLVFLSPGQTLSVLLTTNQENGTYEGSIQGYGRDDIPVVRPAVLFRYPEPSNEPSAPILPEYNDSVTAYTFTGSLRTLYPGRVPNEDVYRSLFIVVGLSNRLCSADPPITGCNSAYRYQGALNNITMEVPTTAILQAAYYNISGVFDETFPDNPPYPFDYTGAASPPPALRISKYATRIIGVEFNDTVEIVLQDDMILGFEDHPMHLHGNNFYILGQGLGNYNASTNSLGLNLWDPPLRNTVSVPAGGWVVLRIKADNPGTWFFHCHLDKHTSWGMQTVFYVHDGVGAANSILPPPDYLTPC